MEAKLNTPITVSRPKDKSLAAYKVWMSEISERLTKGETLSKFTQAEWIANWKTYWKEQSAG